MPSPEVSYSEYAAVAVETTLSELVSELLEEGHTYQHLHDMPMGDFIRLAIDMRKARAH